MKKISLFPVFVLAIFTMLISACGGTAATPTAISAGGKVEPIPVAFIGSLDSIAGDQWVINGRTVTVSAGVIRNGPFSIGDAVKVEGLVNSDGSFTVSKVEAPTPQDVSTLPQFGDDGSGTIGNENGGNENISNENAGNENTSNENQGIGANENGSNENQTIGGNENAGNENSGNENEGNENEENENESNENLGNENAGNENEGNKNGSNENGSQGNGGNENGGNENEGNGNGGNDSD